MPVREQWAYCYTRQLRTYGQRASSRVEANHSTLDTFLADATGDLLDLGTGLKQKV